MSHLSIEELQFHLALKEFREETADVVMVQGRHMNYKNLTEFNNYWDKQTKYEKIKSRPTFKPYYVKKTDVVYKKRNVTQYITVDRHEDKKGWDKQYHWFRSHPNETVYDPLVKYAKRNPMMIAVKPKILVKRSENLKEYDKQYQWFKKHPEAQTYAPNGKIQ